MPKIWWLGPKMTPHEPETAVLNQNTVFSRRIHLTLYTSLEESDIFILKVVPRSDFILAQYFKELHCEQCIFEV